MTSPTSTRSRTITWDPPVDLREYGSLTGLEVLRRQKERGYRTPIGTLMDFRGVQFEYGLAVLEGMPAEFHFNPMGVVHGGFAATLLDAAMGCAMHTTLDPGYAYTTLELKVNYVRAMTGKTGRVLCEGRIVHRGKRVATLEAKILDEQQKLYAHATSTCMVLSLNE